MCDNQKEAFCPTAYDNANFLVPNTKPYFGPVNYIDPLGALQFNAPLNRTLPIYATKVFRYAYQREIRFVLLPEKFQEHLEARPLKIGPLSDIGELIVL